jgi:histidinol-phosphate aminotransferase
MLRTRSGLEYIRAEVRQQPAIGVHQVNPDLHRLQWNENPFDFPADLKEEVLARMSKLQWSRYPLGLRAYPVIDALAKFTGLGSDQIIVGNGSSDILRVVVSSILQAGDHLVTLSPTFGGYASQARLAGAAVHEIPLNPANGFALPIEAILEETVRHKAKLIVICAPNNPTGTIYPYEQLRQIVTQSNAFVLLDEAYAEFSAQDLRPLLAERDNLVLVHTLSKAFALAGVRVGYALAAPEVATQMQKLVNVFTMSTFSETAAIVALEHMDRFQPSIDALVSERERMASALAQLPGVTVYPSGTNFLLVHLGRLGKDAHNNLRSQQRVLVADMGMYAGYQDYLRISVGTPAENELVVNGLAEYLATTPT